MRSLLLPETTTLARWRSALARAAQQVLSARWRSTLDALEAARNEYSALCAAATVDVQALRRVTQRLQGLEQLRAVLARQLPVG